MVRVPGGSQGLISLGVGLAAAGVGAALGLAAERAAVGRELRPSAGSQAGEAFGSLHGPPVAVEADDGTLLHAEVDELPEDVTDSGAADSGAADSGVTDSGAADSGVTDSGVTDSGVTDSGAVHAVHADSPGGPDAARTGRPTIVFSHGYALSLDSWHFQRKALRGRYRLVFWDQRGHGRSATGPHGSATIDQIGRDLGRVIEALAPTGPLVLVGHSMGGMTVMSLAERDPALLEDRVIGVALVSTSAGGLDRVDFGLPGIGPAFQRIAPTAVRALTRTAGIVERGRRVGSDLEALLVRRYSFASPVSAELVRFAADMIAATRLEVISDYLPTFATHDKIAALATLDGHEVLVMVGDHDLLTPVAHSEEIVRRLPGAEHVVVRDSGHLLMLEHPEVVTMHLLDLVQRAGRSAAPTAGERPRVTPSHRTVTPVRRGGRRRDGAA